LNWQDLQDEGLESLVEFVQLNQENDLESQEWANAAFVVITYRFRKDLLQKCTVMCRKAGLSDLAAEEITNRVFGRFYKYPTFNKSKCNAKDIEKCFRFYLYQIARNEFYDYSKPDESPYTGEERIVTSFINPQEAYEPEKLRSLKEAEKWIDDLFSKLTPKHKIIFLTYQYHEKEGRYLPKKVRQELREFLELSQNTIRVYKKEAFEIFNATRHGKKGH
jgi:RNA polymerase sigma factor (sigma-70 family)